VLNRLTSLWYSEESPLFSKKARKIASYVQVLHFLQYIKVLPRLHQAIDERYNLKKAMREMEIALNPISYRLLAGECLF
jgi:hypothetical protein